MITQVLNETVGENARRSVVRPAGDLDETIRPVDGKALEHDRVDQSEDRGVGADAECKGEDRDSQESTSLPQSARGVAQVLGEVLEPAAADVAALFFDLVDTAEFEAGEPPGYVRLHARGDG